MDKRDPVDDFIKEGKLFTTDELKNRIAKMDISELDYQDHPRQHYIDIYDKLILIQENRELLKYYLNIDPNIFQKNYRNKRKIELPLLNESKKPKLEYNQEDNTEFKLPPQHLLDQLVPKKKEETIKPKNTYSRKDNSYPFKIPPNMIDLEPDDSYSQTDNHQIQNKNEQLRDGNIMFGKENMSLKDQSNLTKDFSSKLVSNPFTNNSKTPNQNDLKNHKPLDNNLSNEIIKGVSKGDSKKIIDAISKRAEKKELDGEALNSVLYLKNFVNESVKATLEKIDKNRNVDKISSNEIKKESLPPVQEPILESRVSSHSLNKFNINTNSAFIKTSSSNLNVNPENDLKMPNNLDINVQTNKLPYQRNVSDNFEKQKEIIKVNNPQRIENNPPIQRKSSDRNPSNDIQMNFKPSIKDDMNQSDNDHIKQLKRNNDFPSNIIKKNSFEPIKSNYPNRPINHIEENTRDPNVISINPKKLVKKSMKNTIDEHSNIILYVMILSICALLSLAFIYLYYQSNTNVSSSANLGVSIGEILNLPNRFVSNLVGQWWQTIILIILIFSLYKYVSHQFYKKKLANRIYGRIRETLRSQYSEENYEHGQTIDQIIITFSREFNISESEFKQILLPLIKDMRKKDPYVREFQKKNNGKLAWQWNE